MIKRTLFLATAAAALMLGSTFEADAARCRPGKLYRPSMGVCVSKASRAARPYLAKHHRHAARIRLAKRVETPVHTRPVDKSSPKIDLIGQQIATETPAPSPYGTLVVKMELFQGAKAVDRGE